MDIAANMKRVLAEIPDGVALVVVAKGRPVADILEAVNEGACIIGENYVQEAERAIERIGRRVQWHLTGHLQSNKMKRAVSLFDMIQTVDSASIAAEIDRRCGEAGRSLDVLVQVNSGRERQKSGFLPEEVEAAVAGMSVLRNMKVLGLMTIGPDVKTQAGVRSYFRATRRLFESLAHMRLPNVEMRCLSMGMSDSYRTAIDEGANMVRLGRAIFGERQGR